MALPFGSFCVSSFGIFHFILPKCTTPLLCLQIGFCLRAPKFAIPLPLMHTQFSPTREISQFQLRIFAYNSSERPKFSLLC